MTTGHRHRRTSVTATGINVPVTHKHHADLAPDNGRHLWAVFAVFAVKDPARARHNLDHENLLTIEGPGTGPANNSEAARARNACQYAARTGTLTWRHVLREGYAEAMAEADPARLRAGLVRVAAVCVAWIEAIDRRSTP
jgi:hypothetical protein